MITVNIETHTFPAVGMETVTTETVGMTTRMQDANALAKGIALDIERGGILQQDPLHVLRDDVLTVVVYGLDYTI